MGTGASGPTRRGALALTAALLLGGCASTTPTPMTVYITLPPGATATPTAEPTPSPTEGSSPSESPSASPSESPSGSPTSPAAGCTGSEAHKEYFVNAAKALPWDVYCAVLPSGWWLDHAWYDRADGGHLDITYRNNAGWEISLRGGKLCDDLSDCMDAWPVIGPASFDGLAGTLRSVGSGYAVFVSPHSIPGYDLYSHELTQAQVAAYAAAVIKVARP